VTKLLPALYEARFDEREVSAKDAVWREIVAYLQRYIDPLAPVLDIACDRGHFIRWVKASERWASDIRDVERALPPDVRFIRSSGLHLAGALPTGYFGTVFISNYLEHLDGPEAVVEQLRNVRALLRPDGRAIILQPNIRLVGQRYWDFLDHRIALTDRSLLEAADLADLRPERLVTRFLPYSTKGRLPINARLVRAYLRVPAAWFFLGRQTLLVATRRR
jgi:SAM-dependent methyltransferase